MNRFSVTRTPLEGLVAIKRSQAQDARGFFSRLFCADELASAGFDAPVAQINHTLTRRLGAARGLHFQHSPHAEIKLVSCVRGRVFDVAVDLRRGSPTFLAWHAEILSAENATSLLIPRHFAHGFQTLEQDCELLYLHSTAYTPAAEGALNLSDPAIGIRWPLPFSDVSDKDRATPHVASDFTGLVP
ncbi:MAG TPA: dTDP-4-dehydrorhamnose 3,5-epimerase family protein [Caldimonas sp.]|nr:dTDP-4-dehydrorhamnose 3,5-epimerase family protein [Caldimonas sp.]HEX2542301.1 dTDP-4-dehydrorhamnose 3,5-epimerase family protein [Caldimonas sp.]